MAELYGFKRLNAATEYILIQGVPIEILNGRKGGFVFFTTEQLMAGALFRIPAYGTIDAELVWGNSSVFNPNGLNVYRTEEAVCIVNNLYAGLNVKIVVIGY